MNLKTLADNWKSIASAVAVTVGLFSTMLVWLDNRIETHIEGIVVPALERQAVALNMLRCDLLEVPRLECDPYKGVPERQP